MAGVRECIVVIRPFRPQDNDAVQDLVYSSTMSTVNTFFTQALMREIYFQAIILTAAIMFIFIGIHFYWTLTAIPIVTALFYITILVAHFYRARYRTGDLKDILTTYLSSNKTCFFVAEAIGPLPCRQIGGTLPIAFVNFAEFEKLDWNNTYGSVKEREIVGTIAVTRDRESAVLAWVKHLTVKKSWRGRGIASNLMDTVIKFCNVRSFVAIELVISECHYAARKLLERKGFETRQLYHKKYMYLNSLAIGMQIMSLKGRPTSYRGTAIDL